MTNHLRDQYLLNPEVIFLNHGSFGATPQPVFEAYQSWQRRLEWQPVQFLATELPGHLAEARQKLGDYIHAPAADLVFVDNATLGVNIVARSLDLRPGDEVLATDHEYGACHHTWQFLSQKKGFTYRQQPLPLPVQNAEEIIEQFWQGVTPQTKLIFLSHITSATALHLPIEAICARARAAGILTLVDGAHAPGQITLDMAHIGADFYTGNCHKWLSAPKGSAFLYARPEVQHLLEPLVVSWGWGPTRQFQFGSDFLDYLQWAGTADPSAYLAVPAAIEFQHQNHWPEVQKACHELVLQFYEGMQTITGLAPVYPAGAGFFHQMVIAPLPPVADLAGFKQTLYQKYRVEIPCMAWQKWQFIRISIQAYNRPEDVAAVLNAVEALLK